MRIKDGKKNVDLNAKERITATIGTVHDITPQYNDDQTPITLEETGPNTGVFVSASQLLTTVELPFLPGDAPPPDPAHYQDDDYAVHDGFAGGGPVEDDQPGDRTHRTTIEGRVLVNYGTQSNEVPVFRKADGSNDERKLLEVRVRVFNEFLDQNGNGQHGGNELYNEINGDGQPNTVLGTRQQAIDYVEAQVERANVLWSLAGISVRRVGVISFVNAPDDGRGGNVLHDDFIIDVDETADIGALYANVADIGTLEVIIAGPLRPDTEGQARFGSTLPPAAGSRGLGEKTLVFLSSDELKRTGTVSPLPLRYNTLAYEIGHALTNVGDVDTPAHVLFQDNNTELDDPLHNRRLSASTSWASRVVRAQGQLKAMGNRLLQAY